ncbi:MAG: Ig-like domain repeat protein [Actinomycetota bacterium]
MRLLNAALAAVVLFSIVTAQSPAIAADPGPQWQTTSDTGSLGDDIAQAVGASQMLDHVNQGLDTVFVSGTSIKPAALQAAGIHDEDVGTTAYNANTGELRWKATFDGGVGVNDALGAFEVNPQNNLIYEGINSGNNIVTVERSVSDGKLSRSATYPNASVADGAISDEGGFLGLAGTKGGSQFLAMTYETGSQNLEFDATPVDGHANSADIPHSGSLDSERTLLVTGQSSGFGTGGDMYTVAYNYRTHAKLWERSWASPNNRADEGMVAEADNVSALGKGIGFLAGRTFTPEHGWDIVLDAYDLATGASIWTSPATFDGEISGDDIPLYLDYSDRTSTLYVAGTSERGSHDQDIVIMAFNALSGQRTATAYSAGDSTNGDDAPTGLTVSNDGQRVFVAGTVQNLSSTGDRQEALYAYNSRLQDAGSEVVGGSGDDRSAGVVLNSTQDRAFLAGSTRTQLTGFDHEASSFSVAGFELPPVDIATQLSFTDRSATTGRYGDTATLEARLVDSSGTPLEGRSVTLELAGNQAVATTEADGIARATLPLSSAPGPYDATATFAGADSYLQSSATQPFEIQKAITTMKLQVVGTGSKRMLTATLVDGHTSGLAGRTVTFFADGASIGTAQTGSDGTAKLSIPAGYRGGTHQFRAVFAGDDYYEGSEAAATS